jgi:chemotaxis protein methyltransferase CheR
LTTPALSATQGLLAISDGLPTLFRDLVLEQTGLFFDPDRIDVMFQKLDPLARAQGCVSFLDYYFLLKYDHQGPAEWRNVMNALSVQETYFWRELSQVQALVDVIVPRWFSASQAPLRIWSAACATGEEPYTIAIALAEKGWANHPIEIVASDASESALTKARAGFYRERSFRSLPPHLRSRYFTPRADGWELSPEIKKRVSFHRANIISRPDIEPLARAPVVFCRNVFIYFSPDAIRRTLHSFAEHMPAGGCLCVGSSESLLKLTSDFTLQEINDAFVYVRRDPAAEKDGL